MSRRWLIRCLFLLPILLSVAGWGWSGTHYGRIKYLHDTHGAQCVTEEGLIYLGGGLDSAKYGDWICEVDPIIPARFWPPPDSTATFANFGFRTYYATYPGTSWFTFTVPYWFLIVVFSVILFAVWRITRPKLNSKTAFPIEIGA